jgi:hypothetical protein
VLPEATVLASPAYHKILQLAGIGNFPKFQNRNEVTHYPRRSARHFKPRVNQRNWR